MNKIASLPEEHNSSGFYPTPDSLAMKMLDGIRWDYISTILEPSAGKGNLADAVNRRWKIHHGSRYRSEDKGADIDCIEVDPNLRAILKDKGFRVVHDDFLSYTTCKKYSLIVMNPPFESGAKHILKALQLLTDGGQLIALCNAETLRNPCTNERDLLRRTLADGNAEIEYLQEAFTRAERKTDVEIALIRFKNPESELSHLILDHLKPGHKYVDLPEEEQQAMTKADFVESILDRYNYEVETAVHLIQETEACQRVLNQPVISKDTSYSSSPFELSMGHNTRASVNEAVRRIRKKYWSALFTAPQFMSQLTSNLRDLLNQRVEELADYEFSLFNIREIMMQMNVQVNDGVEKTIMDLFDKWTRKWHWDENSQNRHYFDGWKTNDAFAVNKRVVVRLNAFENWSSKYTPEFRVYKVWDEIADVEKVFNYLDGGRTQWDEGIRETLQKAEKEGQTAKIETKYFFFTFYKKGTCHLEFKDMNILARFNIFAAKGKNWLPPSFGKKKYKDMDPEEQKVAKSFMGSADRYDKVVQYAHYFLAPVTDSNQLKIGG